MRRFDAQKQFRKIARKRLRHRRTIKLSREAWGPPNAHLIVTPLSNNDAGRDYGNDAASRPNANANHLSPCL